MKNSNLDELLELKKLLDSNLISESDFDKKKKEILSIDNNTKKSDKNIILKIVGITLLILVCSFLIYKNSNSKSEVIDNKETNHIQTNRDSRPKDVANVFYDSKYALFDLETDEEIYPNNDGNYDIWYSSNEVPKPFHIILNKIEITNFSFYKFKNKKNCVSWCSKKNNN